jgi:integrase
MTTGLRDTVRTDDIRIMTSCPHIRIRVGAAKGGRPRTVPLWWDAGTLEDLRAWKRDHVGQPDDPFVAPLHSTKRFSRHTLRKRFRTACRSLGA